MKEKKAEIYAPELKAYLIKTPVSKYRFISVLCLLFIAILSTKQSYGQSEPQSVVYDSSGVDIRLTHPEIIESYNNDPDFIYGDALENPTSLFDRIKAALYGILFAIIGNPVGNFIFKAVLIISIAIVVILLLNQLLEGNLTSVFTGKSADKPISFQISEEDIEEKNLEELKEKALKNSDFHAATRYVYLMTLKLLNQKELIHWTIEKTNLDYERELGDHPVNPLFSKLTTFYEFVEYGDFEIDRSGYSKVDSLFSKLREELSS
ncbi:MAG: hypothetical protein RLN83_12495 [Balneola sp.]